ncbi:MFS transporter, partial [Paenibacillus darwinianus]|uniref:hypothetical protein n=1 Tax=Paenibacillus darwinianus TaxID=1380763 RepID=UPI0004521F74
FAPIGWFALSQHLMSGLTFWIVGKWVKRYNKMNSLRAGLILSGMFYLAVLLLGPAASRHVVPLGILNGMAMGFFWMAYNVVYFEITEPGNRDRFNGWGGLLGSGAGMMAPWISGVVIGAFGAGGYRIVFTASLLLFATAAAVSFFLAKRKTLGQYDWLYGIRQVGCKGSPWRRVMPSLAFQGIREGVFGFLLGLLVFLSTSEAASHMIESGKGGVVALVSFWLAGRLLKPGIRSKAMLIGAFAVSMSTLLLFIGVVYGTMLWLGIATAFFMPLYVIPMTSAVFDLIGASEASAGRREELIVLRESGLIAGRVIGLVLYLSVVATTESAGALVWLLLIVGAAPLPGWLLLRGRLTGSEKVQT